MVSLPQLDMRRVYLIARRDFLGYVKTWGFWLSFFMPFVFGFMGFFMSGAIDKIEPTRYETILDETGQYAQPILDLKAERQKKIEWKAIETVLEFTNMSEEGIAGYKTRYESEGIEGLLSDFEGALPSSQIDKIKNSAQGNTRFVDPPNTDLEVLKDYLKGDTTLVIDGESQKLNGVLHIYEHEGKAKADYWSGNVNSKYVQRLAEDYFEDKAEQEYLASGGLSKDGLTQAKKGTTSIQAFDPNKSADDGQAVTKADKIPLIVAAVASGILWLTIFSGAYMLLTSMLEEKLNKLMEMMLATTRFSEVIFGKLLGVAALTITAMLPYIAIGIFAAILYVVQGPPEFMTQFKASITPKLIIFFFVFLILGYVFYGALFIALGSLAESMQDAQTLTTPIMIVLTACILVVPMAFESPDSPLLTFAAWFPLSAPFAAIARLPMDPPWWELALSAFFLFLLSIGVVALAGRIFRYGVLSGSGVKGVTDWIKRVIFRRKVKA